MVVTGVAYLHVSLFMSVVVLISTLVVHSWLQVTMTLLLLYLELSNHIVWHHTSNFLKQFMYWLIFLAVCFDFWITKVSKLLPYFAGSSGEIISACSTHTTHKQRSCHNSGNLESLIYMQQIWLCHNSTLDSNAVSLSPATCTIINVACSC